LAPLLLGFRAFLEVLGSLGYLVALVHHVRPSFLLRLALQQVRGILGLLDYQHHLEVQEVLLFLEVLSLLVSLDLLLVLANQDFPFHLLVQLLLELLFGLVVLQGLGALCVLAHLSHLVVPMVHRDLEVLVLP